MKEIPLTRGLVAWVDDEDYERVIAAGKWYARKDKKKFYAQRRFGKAALSMHIFLMGEKGIDHADGNGLNNQRKSNLRKATGSQNQINKAKAPLNPLGKKPSSPYKGVSWARSSKKWMARIRKDGQQYLIGFFKDEIDAATAYNLTAYEMYGDFARMNVPLEEL